MPDPAIIDLCRTEHWFRVGRYDHIGVPWDVRLAERPAQAEQQPDGGEEEWRVSRALLLVLQAYGASLQGSDPDVTFVTWAGSTSQGPDVFALLGRGRGEAFESATLLICEAKRSRQSASAGRTELQQYLREARACVAQGAVGLLSYLRQNYTDLPREVVAAVGRVPRPLEVEGWLVAGDLPAATHDKHAESSVSWYAGDSESYLCLNPAKVKADKDLLLPYAEGLASRLGGTANSTGQYVSLSVPNGLNLTVEIGTAICDWGAPRIRIEGGPDPTPEAALEAALRVAKTIRPVRESGLESEFTGAKLWKDGRWWAYWDLTRDDVGGQPPAEAVAAVARAFAARLAS